MDSIRLPARLLPILLIIVLTGCSSFNEEQAGQQAAAVGADRLRQAAMALRQRKVGEVPSEQWPNAIRELSPLGVFVHRDGVSIAKYRFYVQESGIYLVFKDAPLPEENSGDPAYRRLADRIYWYHFAG